MSERLVLITGGAQRLGACMSRRLIDHGYHVIIHVRNSREAAELLLSEQRDKHGRVCGAIVEGDLSNSDGADLLIEQLHALDMFQQYGLFGLIHNASYYNPIDINTLSSTDLDSLYHLHMRTPYTLSKHLFTSLAANKGSIIGIIDTSWNRHWKGLTHYTSTKAGLRQMMTSLAGEFSPHVRVNSIGPGAILAADWEEEHFASVLNNVPMGRPGTPEDIAAVVHHFLESPHLNGQFIPVDGGWDLNLNQEVI